MRAQSSHSADVVRNALRQFGMNELEIAVYNACLSIGLKPVSQIAKKAGLNRAYTYDVLSGLIEKGLAREVIANNIKNFVCAPPEALLKLLEEREREIAQQRYQLQQMLPQLEQDPNTGHKDGEIRYFFGVRGVQQMLEETLNTHSEPIYAFTDGLWNSSTNVAINRVVSKTFNDVRVKRNIWLLAISSSAVGPENIMRDPAQKLEARVLFRKGNQGETLVQGGRVMFFILSGPRPHGYVIDSLEIATSLREVHQLLWNSTPRLALVPTPQKAECDTPLTLV